MVTEQEVGRGRARKLKSAAAAGERRRRALLLLQQRGRLPKDHEVLCALVPPGRALEVSLAENSGREAMHPADEFEAFKALIDEGKGVEDVAARFGVSVLTVQRRLKLSALYREDGINLGRLMALTWSDDHAVQSAPGSMRSAGTRRPPRCGGRFGRGQCLAHQAAPGLRLRRTSGAAGALGSDDLCPKDVVKLECQPMPAPCVACPSSVCT